MIELLNQEKWQEKDLLEKMYDDSFYYGHLGKNALSSSSCKDLLKSPKAYSKSLRRSGTTSQALRDGRLFHLCCLEPEKVEDLIIIDGTKARKDFKEAVEAHGEESVYTTSELDKARYLSSVLLGNSEVQKYMLGIEAEVPAIGMIQGIPFRAKADALSTNPFNDEVAVIDLKTTSSDVNDFDYVAKRKFHYDIQAYIYSELFGATDFVFIVIDKDTTDIGIFDCSQEFIDQGRLKVEAAINVYNKYFGAEASEEQLTNYVIRGTL